MGGVENYPFLDASGNRISYMMARKELFESVAANSMIVIDSNRNQTSNDGSFYEAVLSSIICAASHYGGFQGIRFDYFLSEIVRELSLNSVSAAINLSSSF
jgi:hypothetical protein